MCAHTPLCEWKVVAFIQRASSTANSFTHSFTWISMSNFMAFASLTHLRHSAEIEIELFHQTKSNQSIAYSRNTLSIDERCLLWFHVQSAPLWTAAINTWPQTLCRSWMPFHWMACDSCLRQSTHCHRSLSLCDFEMLLYPSEFQLETVYSVWKTMLNSTIDSIARTSRSIKEMPTNSAWMEAAPRSTVCAVVKQLCSATLDWVDIGCKVLVNSHNVCHFDWFRCESMCA